MKVKVITFVIVLMFASLGVAVAEEPTNSCWGQATKVFAQMGEMGEHASQQPTPRLGLRNLALSLYDAGLITDDSMQALGAFVAEELGLSIDACTNGYISTQQSKPVSVAPLSGDEVVSLIPVDTLARGFSSFRFTSDGLEVGYRLIVSNISDVTMAHIHLGEPGVNGPVVVWLFPPSPPPSDPPVDVNGLLAEGTIIADDLVGPLSGGTLEDLRALIESGRAYVNVHTSTYPGGEIRGQIQ